MKESLHSLRKFSRNLTVVPVLLGLFAILMLPTPSHAHDRGREAAIVNAMDGNKQSRLEDLTIRLSSSIGAYHREKGKKPVNLVLTAKMAELAEERRNLLVEMLESNPSAVLGLAMPDADLSGIPPEVLVYIEKRVELTGALSVYHEDHEDSAQGRYWYFLNTPKERIPLYFKTDPEGLLSGRTVKAKGLMFEGVDGALLLESSDHLIDFSLDASANGEINVRSAAAPISNTFGDQLTAVVLLNFNDDPNNYPWTIGEANDLVFGEVNDFILENSYQQTWLSGQVLGWYTIPINSTDPCSIEAIAAEAKKKVNLNGYDRVIYVFPENTCAWAGYAIVGGGTPSEAWINGSFNVEVVGHELLHGFGLLHSHGMNCDGTVVGDNCPWAEYGDTLDIMGNRLAHINAVQKERLGWLGYGASPQITSVTESNTYFISPYESLGTAPKALKILRGTDQETGNQSWLYLEYRQAIGFDGFLSEPQPFLDTENVLNGVVFHLGAKLGHDDRNYLLDMTVDSEQGPGLLDLFDPALMVDSSYTDPEAGVTFYVDSVTSSGASVIVSFESEPDNSCVNTNPDMTLSPAQHEAEAGASVSYSVTVTNRDSASCAVSGFDIYINNLPSGWQGSSSSLNLHPGDTGTASITVTSSALAVDGEYSIGISAENTANSSYKASGTVSYVVNSGSGNSAPVAVDDSITLIEVSPVSINVVENDFDADNDPLVVVSYSNGSKGTVVNNGNGVLTYTPGRRFKNSDSFTYSVSDSQDADSATVYIRLQKSGDKGNGNGKGGGKPR